MHRNKSVSVHNFAMIPSANVPRSSFRIQTSHKTTFDAGNLIPIYVDEILPGDAFNLRMTAFCRLATPINPVMDNLWLETFWFFVPNRLVWDNWKKFMGEQTNPGDSTSFLIPQKVSPPSGYPALSIYDYMGLPTVGQVTAGSTVSHSALFLRAYNLIWNEWFRDENLQNALPVNKNDGPDTTYFTIKKRGKRPDYFTSCLPWPQKGASIMLPLGTTAPVIPAATNAYPTFKGAVSGTTTYDALWAQNATTPPNVQMFAGTGAGERLAWNAPNLVADLSTATAATINQIRTSFQIQKLLERDARGGTRYTEIIRSHFGVISPDARLQRPEYLGGSRTLINVNPVAQTSGTNASGTTTPLGNLSAIGTGLQNRDGFSQAFTEHGIIIGLMNVRADQNYQQGMRKMWSRSTRYDFYFPAFAMLGEQAVLNKEIYCNGQAADNDVFGYQERWAEYRYHPTLITGLFKSTTSGTIDNWHYAEKFNSRPALNDTFIQDQSDSTVSRSTAVGAAANGQQLIADIFFDIKAARPLPLYSVPGLIDHF